MTAHTIAIIGAGAARVQARHNPALRPVPTLPEPSFPISGAVATLASTFRPPPSPYPRLSATPTAPQRDASAGAPGARATDHDQGP